MEIVVLNQDNKLSTFLVLGTTVLGLSLGLIFTRVNIQSLGEIEQLDEVEQENSLYSNPLFYNSFLGAILGCTLGLIKVNIHECQADFAQNDFEQDNYRIDS